MLPGDITPPGQDWIAREFANLRRGIDELAAARSAEATTIGAGGLTIQAGGELRVLHESGHEMLAVRRDTNDRYTVQIRRDDGTRAFVLDSTATGAQYWALLDRGENIVASDDAVAGRGLARPYLPWATVPTAELTAVPQSTTSGAFVSLWTLYGGKQHPRVRCLALTRTDVGTTGEVQLRDSITATVLAGPITLPSGDNSLRFLDGTLPGAYDSYRNIDVEVRRTSGAGNVYLRALVGEGIQS